MSKLKECLEEIEQEMKGSEINRTFGLGALRPSKFLMIKEKFLNQSRCKTCLGLTETIRGKCGKCGGKKK